MKNSDKPVVLNEKGGYFFELKNKLRLFIYDYQPTEKYYFTLFIVSGITGINHNNEVDIIEQLSDARNRVVVIHPRGTGYSDGVRGDISNFSDFINDYIEIITGDKDYHSNDHKIVLFGHSMSTAIVLSVADKMKNIGGAILVNPTYLLKKAKGMSPNFSQYLKYLWFYLFQKHRPIVNMAGDPSLIDNEEDRKDSELRQNDPLLVKYFSLHMMIMSRELMNSMIGYATTANYPLLLIYGAKDSIVDKKGCDKLFDAWKCEKKQYEIIKEGTHGKSTVINSKDIINKWLKKL
jgi:alpha-beta hydrolase superfamily lysophospholipase